MAILDGLAGFPQARLDTALNGQCAMTTMVFQMRESAPKCRALYRCSSERCIPTKHGGGRRPSCGGWRRGKSHLHDAASDAVLLSQTLTSWAENVQGDLLLNMPDALLNEMVTDLPAHPCDLLRTAMVDGLFGFEPFRGVLGDLSAL